MKLIKCLIFILMLLNSNSAFAFKIIEPDIHESMTRASKACLDQFVDKETPPENCSLDITNNEDINISWMHDSSLAIYDIPGWIMRALDYTTDYPTLEDAVRWPDDPTKELSAGAFKFGSKLLTDTCEGYRNPITKQIDLNAGLICVSHYGDLQFLHAQASSEGELASDTYEKIIDWASFLYLVASKQLSDEDLEQEYCSYFSKDTKFHKAMLPSNSSVPCTSKKGTWRVATLFNLTCSSPKPSAWGCNEWIGDKNYEKARIMATGALLHLIQDSFSQSHVERGTCEINDKKVVAKVECLPLTKFTTYKGQENHGDADLMPIFKNSCNSSGSIDNPILAGAKALWYIKNEKPTKKFKQDVLYRIFGTPEYIKQHGMSAERGQCFENKL